VRPTLEREVYERKLAAEIPKFFNELKKVANPNLLLKGPPSSAEILEAAQREFKEIQQAGGIQPGQTAQPVPPKK
jgi:hypothetical protein